MKYLLFYISFFPVALYGYRTSFQSAQGKDSSLHSKLTIMLSPEGDAKNPGRQTPDGAERGVTRILCEHVKKELERLNPSIRIVFSHNSGETITQQEKANFANRLQVDLYIAILLYQDEVLSLALYYYGKPGDTVSYQPKKLSLCKQQDAHIFSQQITQSLINRMYKSLVEFPGINNITIKTPLQIPLKPLIGIKAPSCAFEGSLKQAGDWEFYISALAQSIADLLHAQGNI